ncbi:MAG: hypothetical protein ACYDCO_03265 [Armatimonadota bacterium]
MDPRFRNRRRPFLLAAIVLLGITAVAWWCYAHRPLSVAAVISDAGYLVCTRSNGVVTFQRPGTYKNLYTGTAHVRCYTWSGKLRWQIAYPYNSRDYGYEQHQLGISPDGRIAAIVKPTEKGLLVQSWHDGKPAQRIMFNPWRQFPKKIDCSIGARNDGSLLVACGGIESPDTAVHLLAAGKVTASGSYHCPPPNWITSKILKVRYNRIVAVGGQSLFIRSYITHAVKAPTLEAVAYSTETVSLRVRPPAITVADHYVYKQFNCRMHYDGSLTSADGSRYDALGQLSSRTKGNVYCTIDGGGQMTVTGTKIAVAHWIDRKAQSPWSAIVPARVIRPYACASPNGEYAFVLCQRRSRAFSLLCRVAGQRLHLRASPYGKDAYESTWPYPVQMLLYQRSRRVSARSLLLRQAYYPVSQKNVGYGDVIDIGGRRVALDYNEPDFSPDGRWLLLSARKIDGTDESCYLILRVK